jgi:hypothetical protein
MLNGFGRRNYPILVLKAKLLEATVYSAYTRYLLLLLLALPRSIMIRFVRRPPRRAFVFTFDSLYDSARLSARRGGSMIANNAGKTSVRPHQRASSRVRGSHEGAWYLHKERSVQPGNDTPGMGSQGTEGRTDYRLRRRSARSIQTGAPARCGKSCSAFEESRRTRGYTGPRFCISKKVARCIPGALGLIPPAGAWRRA